MMIAAADANRATSINGFSSERFRFRLIIEGLAAFLRDQREGERVERRQ